MSKRSINNGLLIVSFLACISVYAKSINVMPPEATASELELSYSELPYLTKAFIDLTPAQRKDGLAVGELGVDGGNKEKIIKFAQEMADYKHGFYDSLLISHKGKLVFESYFSKGRVNLPHYQASATKSYTGLALGRAIQLGFLTMADLNKPVISFFEDLDVTTLAKGVEKITLSHALTMTSGIRISDEQWQVYRKIPSQFKGIGELQTRLEQTTPITEESQAFKYGIGPVLIMHVIEAVVPGSAKDFIKRELLDKLDITNYRWMTNGASGLPEAGWRTSMTSRDMLKWGMLIRNKGKWQGEQLVPTEFIINATVRQVYTGDEEIHFGGKDVSNQGYGYFWWGTDVQVGDKHYYNTTAQGGNGQLIMFIEELDLLIVHTAHDNKTSYKQVIAEHILPAFTN